MKSSITSVAMYLLFLSTSAAFLARIPLRAPLQPHSALKTAALNPKTTSSQLCLAVSVETARNDTISEAKPLPPPSSGKSIFSTNNETNTSRFRRLKDVMWVRETLEDLTSAEFASSIDAASSDPEKTRKRKRAIDYDNLLSQLDRRIVEMGCDPDEKECDVSDSWDTLSVKLKPNQGMGCLVYKKEQREQLLNRILKTRQTLRETMKGHAVQSEEDEIPFPINLPEFSIPKEEDAAAASGPKLYVRDDGTVDWDGALQDRAALRNFGTAVWARINGRDPESIENDDAGRAGGGEHGGSAASLNKPVTAKIEETEAIRRERDRLENLQEELKEMEAKHTALLNSALRAGQAVANINLATLDPKRRIEIQESASNLEIKKEEVSYQMMNFELERIFTYLAGELGNPAAKGYIPLQDRLNVAEFGLLESQIESFNRDIETGEYVDADLLQVVVEQLADFKRRLGIDYFVTGLTFDGEAIQRWLADLWVKTRRGVAFYVKGCELFWNDIVFALTLIGRALQGYTLKPREVRNLRRTFKDIVTFIPVVIILIIPLSPVGHVLVFGAIQRFFPDFFPSCFTESRQNLLQLYESAEYTEVTINESPQEKVVRLSKALAFSIVSLAQKLAAKISGRANGDDDEGR